MRQRIFLLVKLFVATLCFFLTQKPLFMLYNSAAHSEVGAKDYIDVMLHALPLDLTTSGYLTIVPWLVIIVSWFTTAKRVKQFPLKPILAAYYAIIAIFMALIFVSDAVLYEFWNFKIDSTVFIYTDKPGDALASVSAMFVAACVFAIVLLSALYIFLYAKLLPKSPLRQPARKWSSLIMLPIAGLLFLAIRGGVGEGTANVSNVFYSENQFLNHSAVNPVFNMLYSMMHQQDFANEFRFLDDAEREEIVERIYPRKAESTEGEALTDTLLSVQRPNVLLIVWEGCGAKMVQSLGGVKSVTPNLAQIASEGVMFTQCYANSFRTDRGLLSLMTGWIGMPSASLMKIPNKCNNLPGMARSLQEAGYSTDFWYGGDISFTNMGGFMLGNGFQTTHSDEDFSRSDRSYSKWGVMDGVLLDTLASTIISRQGEKPWFTSVLTLSSHEPWEVPYSRLENERLNSFAYTDDALGKFIYKLKRSEQWHNLLVVIVPDHGVMIDDSDTRSSLDVIHIPLVLSGGALACSKRIDTIMNQSDLAATLLAQLGVSHADFAFSRNVLSSRYAYPTAIHTSAADATFIDSTGITTYDLNGKCVTFSSSKDGDDVRTKKAKAILQTVYDKAAEL